ncbi:hypothetical protein [Roseovarius dicentrarchi]|uniref:hypothetical protein n=1 Tax=Roseovarius dicentrarchi TaxID=2250573 RepID=UPI000DE8FF14|nr:hypothetical protein [Roseovarius dicentrarchi]
MFRFTRKTLCMSPRKTISACLKGLSYLAIICALMFLPPSASHAASGMHGDQHGAAAHSAHSVEKHAHGAASANLMHDASESASQGEHEKAAAGECCSGLCVSVVLDDSGIAFARHAGRGKYRTVRAQPDSIESAGFLRPPLYLI